VTVQVKLWGKTLIGREFDYRWGEQERELLPSTESQENKKAKAVQLIVQERFAFPSKAYPKFRTFTNYPDHTMGVRTHGEEDPLFPDIVVINQQENEVVMTAEVEVTGSLTRRSALDWARISRRFKTAFYLYVPVGQVDTARRLAKAVRAEVTAYRTWRETPYGIEVNEL
jgi:hypothetical protein